MTNFVEEGVRIPGTTSSDLVTTEGNYIFTQNGIDTDFTDAFEPRKKKNAFLATEGSDEINTGRGADKICAGGGDDDITSGEGADTVDAGAGDDFVDAGSGDDIVRGEGGDDIIEGKGGKDILIGGEGNDDISGGAGADQISGGEGNDAAYGGGGADQIDLGNGDDYAEGGAGADSICGGEGKDEIYGNIGDDLIAGGYGVDKLYGGDDDDAIYGGEQVFGEDSHGDKTYEGDLDTSKDHIEGGAGDDCLVGGGGNDYIEGGDDDDIILGDDVLGVSGAEVLHDTNFGDDDLYGNGGNDRIDGGNGDDTIDGGAGDDVIAGSAGDDTLTGGAGDDRFIYRQREGGTGQRDTITDFEDGDVIVLWGQRTFGVKKVELVDEFNGFDPLNDVLVSLTDGNEIVLLDAADLFTLPEIGYVEGPGAADTGPDGWVEYSFYTDKSCVIDCDVDCCPEVEDPGAAWVAADSNGGGMGG